MSARHTCNTGSHSIASRVIKNGRFGPLTQQMTTRTHTLGRGALSLVAPLLAAIFGGCTVTTNDTPTTASHCDQDSGITCASPSVGYACTGSALPTDTDSSIRCGDGIDSNGTTDFCCEPRNSCEIDTTITSCGSSATPYTCSGSEVPTDTDQSLNCGPPVSGPNGTLSYCCNVATGATADCGVDTSITSCGDASTPYTCTGGLTPTDTDEKLVCGDGVPGATDGTEAFCCIDFTSNTCAADPDVVGCSADSYGFSCTSTASPDQEDPSLTCSDPIVGKDGKTLYCCSQ